ncbi:SRPBCC family protein [Mycobacterium vicinigordonae]|uniref:SRPBCC family protein n=1 Tax=Mycobacterium vicinigordonae TaxID=1719132 RepID=A0A7D6I7Z7_9MYCO|nr:SRPBCC family protein [Mycobacterium vicinigordonae]QLL08016.1 SRPBCC family protein [Mycobacterium vicinigordonae]
MSNGARVEQSRTIPVTPEQAFRGIIEMDIPTVFRRRYGPLPPIVAVSGRDAGHWSGAVGQTRVLELGGGFGALRETVVEVDEPHAWRYRISDLRGPLGALLTGIDGEFLFAPAGTGTRITWRYNMFPRSPLVEPVLPAFGWFWRGYARQMLEELSKLLVK